jgi:glycosyltransferase involved in cell wall biosynthesis
MKFSIIIPIFNEAKAIKLLLESIRQIDFDKSDFEVIVVDDASTDDTHEVLAQSKDIKFLVNENNLGRYATRIKGAKTAINENLVFVDSRCIVASDFLKKLENKLKELSKTPVIIGHSLAQEKENDFEIMYRVVRQKLFAEFYKVKDKDIWLDKASFDRFPKGSTVFYAPKDILLLLDSEHGNEFGKDSSDDTKMLKYLMDYSALVLSPALQVVNYARGGVENSLEHLFRRGAKFIDYYLDPTKRNFWLVIFFPLFMLGITIINFYVYPIYTAFCLFVLWVMGTFYLGDTLKERKVIFYMLPVVVFTFYSGIIRGIILKLIK